MLVGGGPISIPGLVSDLKTGTWELSYLSMQRAAGSMAGLVILVSVWEALRAQLCRHVFLSHYSYSKVLCVRKETWTSPSHFLLGPSVSTFMERD